MPQIQMVPLLGICWFCCCCCCPGESALRSDLECERDPAEEAVLHGVAFDAFPVEFALDSQGVFCCHLREADCHQRGGVIHLWEEDQENHINTGEHMQSILLNIVGENIVAC